MVEQLPELSAVIRKHNLSARKGLGQHFLLDMQITSHIATLAAPLKGVHVAEVGPGPGGLTRALLQTEAESVYVIERDSQFLIPLNDLVRYARGRLHLIHADALHLNLAEALPQPMKIIANLPYNIGTKLLINWLTQTPLFWTQAILMFQKEVAERITAHPNDKAYGRLAILSQSLCRAHIAFTISAQAFTPSPKVDSAVIVLNPLPESQRFKALETLSWITAAAFGQRRKMLRQSLKAFARQHKLDIHQWLASCHIDPALRAEDITVVEYQALAQTFTLQTAI